MKAAAAAGAKHKTNSANLLAKTPSSAFMIASVFRRSGAATIAPAFHSQNAVMVTQIVTMAAMNASVPPSEPVARRSSSR